MEKLISRRILRRYFTKLEQCLDLDVAIVGAGPSGLLCALDLAKAGKRVAIFERTLKPGGGIWGGAMLFNEIVIQEAAVSILDELGISHSPIEEGVVTADSVEVASALIYHAVHAGAHLFNGISVEDVVFKKGEICGLVINWAPVLESKMHVDPLMISARCVLDAGGHHAELTAKIARKAGIRLETATGEVMGERPMWAEEGERMTVENTGLVYPGLYVSGMAANGVRGSFRMGPIFGGMFLSGRKAARLILEDLK
jgi:sulfide-dependent adenosine diphosphate thiazole synthase